MPETRWHMDTKDGNPGFADSVDTVVDPKPVTDLRSLERLPKPG